MKFCRFSVIFFGITFTACSPTRLFLIDHSGVLTYNRNTGQLDIIWEWKERPTVVERDSVPYLERDSIDRILNEKFSND